MNEQQQQQQPGADEAPPVGELFVGRLRRNEPFDQGAPSTYCVDGRSFYRGAVARVGRINLFGAAVPEALADGDWVVVRGVLHAQGLFAQLAAEDGECPQDPSPPMQWRSDWSADEGGHRTTQAALEAAPWLEASELWAAPLPVLEVTLPAGLERSSRKGGLPDALPADAEVVVVVRNPLPDTPWQGVELRAHYESRTHGKPMALYETRTLDLEPGGSVTLHLPALTDQELTAGMVWTGTFHAAHLRGGQPQALGSTHFAD